MLKVCSGICTVTLLDFSSASLDPLLPKTSTTSQKALTNCVLLPARHDSWVLEMSRQKPTLFPPAFASSGKPMDMPSPCVHLRHRITLANWGTRRVKGQWQPGQAQQGLTLQELYWMFTVRFWMIRDHKWADIDSAPWIRDHLCEVLHIFCFRFNSCSLTFARRCADCKSHTEQFSTMKSMLLSRKYFRLIYSLSALTNGF